MTLGITRCARCQKISRGRTVGSISDAGDHWPIRNALTRHEVSKAWVLPRESATDNWNFIV